MLNIQKKTRIVDLDECGSIPEDVYSSNEPILLKGLAKNWSLVKAGLASNEQAIELLKSFYSGKPSPVYFGEPEIKGRLAYNKNVSALNFETRRVNLAEVLDELLQNISNLNPPARYIASNIIDIYFPGLRDENDLVFAGNYFDQNPMQKGDPLVGIWIGNQTTAPCHYDAQSNVAVCAVGTRRFTLFPPEQIHNLYPGPIDLTPGGPAISMVDFANPDYDKYPRFNDALATAELAELEPGDALFIPCMWWHHVEALKPFNILINYWWNNFPDINGQAVNVLNHALLSIRDRPKEEKEAWKQIFDYYIFGDSELAGEHLPEPARGVLGPIDETKARQLRAQLINKLNR